MFSLIKKVNLYNPENIGIKDVLICMGKIVAVEDVIEISGLNGLQVFEAEGLNMVPGFIDQHVHIMGGGGEGGFETRTLEISVVDLYENGITTVVGILGTDGVTRSVAGLYAKACELEEKGITAYIYTGSYEVPPITLTGDVQNDIVFIDKVIGIGEISISDHRSFNPSLDELKRIGAISRVGGLIGGKAGVVHLHMGDGADGLKPILDVVENTLIPLTQFVPSHVNRNKRLFSQSMEYLDRGGNIDITTGFERGEGFEDCIPSYEALDILIKAGKPLERVTMSSDANGSSPTFDKDGNLKNIQIAKCNTLFNDFKKAVIQYNIKISDALKPITINPAKLLRLKNKGTIELGKDADFLLLDKELNIKKVHTRVFLN